MVMYGALNKLAALYRSLDELLGKFHRIRVAIRGCVLPSLAE